MGQSAVKSSHAASGSAPGTPTPSQAATGSGRGDEVCRGETATPHT